MIKHITNITLVKLIALVCIGIAFMLGKWSEEHYLKQHLHVSIVPVFGGHEFFDHLATTSPQSVWNEGEKTVMPLQNAAEYYWVGIDLDK